MSDPQALARRRLIALLQRAHAGERAAFHAYEGHWRSVWNREEREAIRRIGAEEWEHRDAVADILAAAGGAPSRWREALMLLVGLTIHLLCRLGGWAGPIGWYAAMDGAGRLEAGNVQEYVTAATHARDAGLDEHVPCLLHMAQVEWDHEAYFHGRCAEHWLQRVAPGWRRPAAPPSELPAAALGRAN